MNILYNCHTDGDQYRITKFNDGEVESSYLCSHDECQCPAGHRPSCRHRLMLPMFIARGAVNTFWFLDFERKGWVSNEPADEPTLHGAPIQQEHLDLLYPSKRSEFKQVGSQTGRFTSSGNIEEIEHIPAKPWRRI